MTDDRSPAFGTLEERAAAMAGANPPDRLSLRDHGVAAEIGAFQHERGQGQRPRFNAVVELAPPARQGEGAQDDADPILAYDRLPEPTAAALTAQRPSPPEPP